MLSDHALAMTHSPSQPAQAVQTQSGCCNPMSNSYILTLDLGLAKLCLIT